MRRTPPPLRQEGWRHARPQVQEEGRGLARHCGPRALWLPCACHQLTLRRFRAQAWLPRRLAPATRHRRRLRHHLRPRLRRPHHLGAALPLVSRVEAAGIAPASHQHRTRRVGGAPLGPSAPGPNLANPGATYGVKTMSLALWACVVYGVCSLQRFLLVALRISLF